MQKEKTEKKVEIEAVKEGEKTTKEAEEYYEAESWQFSSCGD